jgi:hypothetical protein
MEPKILPLGDPSFRNVIKNNLFYADKTEYIHKMIKNFRCCFLVAAQMVR